jgi:hypothetical protein
VRLEEPVLLGRGLLAALERPSHPYQELAHHQEPEAYSLLAVQDCLPAVVDHSG